MVFAAHCCFPVIILHGLKKYGLYEKTCRDEVTCVQVTIVIALASFEEGCSLKKKKKKMVYLLFPMCFSYQNSSAHKGLYMH